MRILGESEQNCENIICPSANMLSTKLDARIFLALT